MKDKIYNDEINYIDFYNIVKKKILFIGLFTSLLVFLVFIFDKEPKITSKYQATLRFEIGSIVFLPDSLNQNNIPSELIKKLFLKKMYLDNGNILFEVVSSEIDGVFKIKKNRGVDPIPANMIFKINAIDNSIEALKLKSEKIIDIVLERSSEIAKKYKHSDISLSPTKEIGNVKIVKLKDKVQQTLKMKLIIATVMGLIFSIMIAIFLNRLEFNRKDISK